MFFLSILQARSSALDLTLNYSSLLRGVLVAVLSASLWSIFFSSKKSRTASELSQLPGPTSISWFQGNHSQLFNLRNGWEFHKLLAVKYGPAIQVRSFLRKRQFYTFDPKAMHHILVKDGLSYEPLRIGSGAVMFGKGLLTTIGGPHRKQRKLLNPVFSIAHMRSVLPIFYNVVDRLENALSERVRNGPREIDLLAWMARTALELIGQSGFGYSFDDMKDDEPKDKYSIVIKSLTPALVKVSLGRFYIVPLAIKVLPVSLCKLIMNVTPWKTLHDVRDMLNYMWTLSVKIYEDKKRALEEGDEAVSKQIGQGKDLLSIMMKENMKAEDEDKLEEDEIIGQTTTFVFAAMDTTSNAMSRILNLLCLHPNVQDKLRKEIVDARKEREGRRLTYDELVSLPYLDAICRETLRLYAPVSSMFRKCTDDVIVPLSKPVRGVDGSEITEVFLPKNTSIVLSILNANRSEELWGPDALEWKPERWLESLPESVTESKIPGVYSHLMTFSGGGRSCIGFKFSQLEMKVVIAMLVEKFKFSLPQDKEIFWQMSSISTPVIVGGDVHPQLPLVVELVK
ncbi:hypothetical protein GYMLUDRAFT_700611 [Collybiopsis luxurians FD-317 M1]|uniref:Unplaced genomic scaffold GYMLUscaffold_38, whole genome shotgun sequence n=1 Tax=Collybiopsis luxurians FD-317 M1 TaxID=944289 RepID=A0A0D0BSB7_9AGAR|nr:hypothetical protein GYMLUDRAFT_700611 [Collybiopsis luxurians FD-317 M1]